MLSEYFLNRRGITELSRLSDKELDDIGLTRGDVYDLDKENSIFSVLKRKLFSRRKDAVEEYLSQAVDRVDFEGREKELRRRGILPC